MVFSGGVQALRVVAKSEGRHSRFFGGGGEHGGVRPSGGEDGAGARAEALEDGGTYMRYLVSGNVREGDVRAVVGELEGALGCTSVRYRTLEQEVAGELVAAPVGPRTGLAGAPPDSRKATQRQYASVRVYLPLPPPQRTELPIPEPAAAAEGGGQEGVSQGVPHREPAHSVGPDGALEGAAWTAEDDEAYKDEVLFGYKPPALLRCVGTAVPGLKLENGERLPAVILPVVDERIPGESLEDPEAFLAGKKLTLAGSAVDRSGFRFEPWRPSLHRMTVVLHRPTELPKVGAVPPHAPPPEVTWRIEAFVRAQRDTYLAAVKCLDKLKAQLASGRLVAFDGMTGPATGGGVGRAPKP